VKVAILQLLGYRPSKKKLHALVVWLKFSARQCAGGAGVDGFRDRQREHN
jgi:hypothetical protein